MIEVWLIKENETLEIPVQSVEWKGKRFRAPRQITVELPSTSRGLHRPAPVTEGDGVVFFWKERQLFQGTVFQKEENASGTMTFTAYDSLYYLVHNKDSYVFENKKASDILKRICRDFEIDTGTIVDTGYVKPHQVNDEDTLYDIVLAGLQTTFEQTGERYVLRSRQGMIELVKQVDEVRQWVVEEGVNLTDYRFSTSIEETATRVKLLSGEERHPMKVAVDNEEWQERFGVLQYYENVAEKLNRAQLQQRADELLKQKGKSGAPFHWMRSDYRMSRRDAAFMWWYLNLG